MGTSGPARDRQRSIEQWRRRLCSCVAVKGGDFEQSLIVEVLVRFSLEYF